MLKVYCDGACSGNPGPGAWAYLAIEYASVEGTDAYISSTASVSADSSYSSNGMRIIASAHGSYDNTTNNRMELLAAINAVYAFDDCIIVVDSKYVKDGITSWVKKWRSNGWKSSTGPVKNLDLWQELDSIVTSKKAAGASIQFEWEKGHNNTTHDLVDALARGSVIK